MVAATFAEYSVKVAEYKGCKAQAAKGGGVLAVAGCGLAAFMTGGLALAVCGGSLVAGAVMSEGCDSPPPEMTSEDIRRIAEARTGQSREPICNRDGGHSVIGAGFGRRSPATPYRDMSPNVGSSRRGAAVGRSAAKGSGTQRRALRKAEKQRRKHERRQRRRDKKVDAALEW